MIIPILYLVILVVLPFSSEITWIGIIGNYSLDIAIKG